MKNSAKIKKHSAGDPNACALCYCLGYSGPFVLDMSLKLIDREGLGGNGTGTRQYQQIENGDLANQSQGFTLDYV